MIEDLCSIIKNLFVSQQNQNADVHVRYLTLAMQVANRK